MTRLSLLIVTCILFLNPQVYAAQESKLGTAFNATIWGAGIGIVSGLGLASLATSDDEELGTTTNRVRNYSIEGFGVGILAGLIYGIKQNKNLGYFFEGKYNKYWNREWYDFKFGINYVIF